MKIDSRGAVFVVGSREHPEYEAFPAFDMDGAVEEGLAGQRLAVELDGERIVERGLLERGADGLDGLIGDEGDRGAVRAGGLVRLLDGRAGTAEKAVGGDLGEPALGEVGEAGVGSRGDGAAHAREGVDADPGGVLALRRCLVPAAAPEGEQHRGVGDTAPVVGDDDDVFSVLEGGPR